MSGLNSLGGLASNWQAAVEAATREMIDALALGGLLPAELGGQIAAALVVPVPCFMPWSLTAVHLLIAVSLAFALRAIVEFGGASYIWIVSRIATGCPVFLDRPSRPKGVKMKIVTHFGGGAISLTVFLAAQAFGQAPYTTPEAQKAAAELSLPAGPPPQRSNRYA